MPFRIEKYRGHIPVNGKQGEAPIKEDYRKVHRWYVNEQHDI
jgi:hypothetical protein